VKLSIESGYSLKRIASELGMGDTRGIREWIRRYKLQGEEGLKDRKPQMKEITRKRRAEKRELEELRAENALLKYLLEVKKKEDMKQSKN
jgi:transposase